VLLLHYSYEQLQHGAVPSVLLLHYCYNNYNTLQCPPCYYYITTTTTTTRRRACRDARPATTTQLVRQLEHAAMLDLLQQHYNYDKYNTLLCPPSYNSTTTTTNTTCCRAHGATTTLLLRQLQHADMLAMLPLHYYYENYKRSHACRDTATLLFRQQQHVAMFDLLLLH